MIHQLKIAKMVTGANMTPAYHLNRKKKPVRSTRPQGNRLCLETLTKLNVPAVTGKKKGETSTANTTALNNAAAA